MINIAEKIFSIDSENLKDESMEDYIKDFRNAKTTINIKRCKIFGMILILLNCVLILVDLLIYSHSRMLVLEYKYLFYSHIGMLTFIPIWLLVLRIAERKFGTNTNTIRYVLYYY